MNNHKESTSSDIGSRLDTMILLLARSLYKGEKVNDVALELVEFGLTPRQIALVLGTSLKNVQNRLGEAKKVQRVVEEV